MVEATNSFLKSLLNQDGVPGTLQVPGMQLGKADKVQASMGLPFWRWHQMATSALKIGAEGPGGRQGCFMEGE